MIPSILLGKTKQSTATSSSNRKNINSATEYCKIVIKTKLNAYEKCDKKYDENIFLKVKFPYKF